MDEAEALAEVDRLFALHSGEDQNAFERAVYHALWGIPRDVLAVAEARMDELKASLAVRLTATDDVLQAEATCREAGRRLRTSSWYRPLVEAWPAPIAHEVRELVNVLDGSRRGGKPSPEAALMQMRDAAETMLKLPAIVLVRYLLDRGGEDAGAARRDLTKVRGGEWNALARKAAGRVRAADPGGPLDRLAGLFLPGSRYGVAGDEWCAARNATLGHAALRPNPAETACIVAWFASGQAGDPQPHKPQATTLAQGLAAGVAADPWHGLVLQAASPDGPIPLTGAAALDGWRDDHRHARSGHQDNTLPLQLVLPGGRALNLFPFAGARICRECGRRDVFLFDTVYNRVPWKFDFLDYARGHRLRLDHRDAADVLSELDRPPDAEAPIPSRGGTLDSRETIAALDRMRVDKRYRSPGYLRQPLRSWLASNDRGIYWLQAPAHVGKTMFALGLARSELRDEPIDGGLSPERNIVLLTLKREFHTGRSDFLNTLADGLKAALDLRNAKDFPEISKVRDAPDPGAAIVPWLDEWRALTGDPSRRLLLVIDGLDEEAGQFGIVPPSSIFPLIPAAAALTPGLYVLLTSRVVGEVDCPAWLPGAVAPILAGGITATRRLSLDDPGYVGLLHEYVAGMLGAPIAGSGPGSRAERLVAQAEGRFVFLSFLVEQLRAGLVTDETVAEAGRGEEIYRRFIEDLPARYGEKRADDLLRVLACLTACERAHAWVFDQGAVEDIAAGGLVEPLPRAGWPGLELDLLAAAAGMDEPTDAASHGFSAAFVEALLLLQGTLWVWRGGADQPRYRLGLKGLHEHMGVLQPGLIRLAHARLAGLCLDAVDGLAEEDAQRPSLSTYRARTVLALAGLLHGHAELAGSEPMRHRLAGAPLLDVVMKLDDSLEDRDPASPRLMRWRDLAIFSLSEPRQADGEVSPVNAVAVAYMNRGNAKQSAPGHGPAAAITDYDAAIRLMEALRDTLGEGWPVPWRNDLARVYVNRGNAKQSAPGHGPAAAITDYDAAIRLREALRDTLGEGWPVPWRNDLANAYMNRGNAKQSAPGHGPAAAITDYDAAIRLREALRDTLGEGWPVPWRNDLANAYMNRGNAKQSAPGHGPAAAITDYDAAIRLREALRDTLGEGWPLPWRNDLATAYVNRGNAKQSAPGHGPAAAIADYDAAIRLMEALRDTLGEGWPVPWRNDLAGAYVNRGNAKQDAPGHGPAAAITDYDAAIRLMEALRDTSGEGWPVPWRNDLARAYVNRGNAKQDAPGHGPAAAITDYDAAIRLMEALRDTLGEGWPVPWRNDLANAYVGRGNAKQSAPGHGPAAAITDYDAAIRLMEALRDTSGEGWPVSWRNDLANAYVNRGIAKQSAPGHGPAAAITDYDAAIRLKEALRDTLGEGWPLPWRNDLATAYVNRGIAKQSAPGHGPAAAIADYDAAIRLTEALRDTSGEDWPVPWRNDLANAYANRANAKRTIEGFGKDDALQDYDRAIDLWRDLEATLGPDLPPTYAQRLVQAERLRAGTAAAP